MAVQLLISFLVTLSIVASGWLLANAQKDVPADKQTSTQVTRTSPAEKPDASKQEESTSKTTPETSGVQENSSESQSTDTTAVAKPLPVLMELSSPKNMYHPEEDIFVKAELWAVQPVTLCLYTERPEANFTADIYRGGYGKLDFVPKVVQLKQQDMRRIERVRLEAGQMHRIVFNVKKLMGMPPAFWKTGEYTIKLKFYLCGHTEQDETEIPSQSPLRLLVLD